jgi:hypothetical protein
MKSPGENLVLDELYIALSVLEQRELDLALMERTEHRSAVQQAMLPIKREINRLEDKIIYDEAVDSTSTINSYDMTTMLEIVRLFTASDNPNSFILGLEMDLSDAEITRLHNLAVKVLA